MYPVTIIKTRYQGTYEGGVWAAFPCYPSDIPSEAFGDDTTCANWWKFSAGVYAVGYTPDEAVKNLKWLNLET